MSPDPDDDALRWEGDDDPTLAPGWKVVGNPSGSKQADAAASGQVAESNGATAVDHVDGEERTERAEPVDEGDDADVSAQPGSAELVLLGVLGGVYLLYSVGWLIWAISSAPDLGDPVAQFMYGLGRWLAVLAPALWFGTVLWLASERQRARLLWLIVGALVLVPVPFLLRG